MDKEKKADKITLYMLLGVNEKATENEIRKAYKKMVYIVHPDKNPNDPNANENFRNLNKAYKILMNDEKRKLYDETGEYDENEDEKIDLENTYQYYREIYPKLKLEDIENFSLKYRGSEMEEEDLIDFYNDNNGDITLLLEAIPLSKNEDIGRFIKIYERLIKKKKIKKSDLFFESKEHIKLLIEDEDEKKEAEDTLNDLKQQIMLNHKKRGNNNFFDNLMKKYGNENDYYEDINDEECEKVHGELKVKKKGKREESRREDKRG
jgi:DnaJ family protein C protein 9